MAETSNAQQMGFVKRIKLNQEGQPPDMAGKFLGFLPVWMAPPNKLDAPPHEYQMMGLAVFTPIDTMGSEEARKRAKKDLDAGCVRYEILMTSSIAGQMQGVTAGESVVLEYTGQHQKSRRGFNVDLYYVKRDVAMLQAEPMFTFLPTPANWNSLPAALQDVAMRRKSLGLGAVTDDVIEMQALPSGSQEELETDMKGKIWSAKPAENPPSLPADNANGNKPKPRR